MEIGMFGVKGGSGVTTTATMLFSHLAQRKNSVTLVTDSDGMAACGMSTSVAQQRHGDFGVVLNTEVDRTSVPTGDVIIRDGMPVADGINLLVIRPCYLFLRRLVAVQDDIGRLTLPSVLYNVKVDGIVLIEELGRALGKIDVERAAGLPVVASIPFSPAISRASDAGLLLTRMPSAASEAMESILNSLVTTIEL